LRAWELGQAQSSNFTTKATNGEERDSSLHSDWPAEKWPLAAEILSLPLMLVDGH